MIKKNPKYNLNTITNFIINYSSHHNLDTSNLKLQKILYFVQSQFIINTKQVCFVTPIYAGSFGPIIKPVYDYFKHYGISDINILMPGKPKQTIAKQDQDLIINVLRQSAKYTDTDLLYIIYRQTPFKTAQNNTTKIIDINNLYRFFIK